jgi:FlaA1/EpsC-like NDP-sugar epimerase
MKRIFQEKVHSRWLILFIDQFILSWALCMSLLLIHRIDFIALLDLSHLAYIVLFHFIAIPVFILMEIHTGIIRYSNTKDMVRIFLAVLLSSMLFTGISNLFIVPYLQLELAWLDTVLLLNFFISSSLLILLRIVVKGLFAYFKDL